MGGFAEPLPAGPPVAWVVPTPTWSANSRSPPAHRVWRHEHLGVIASSWASSDITTLMRQEVELAKTELRQSVSKASKGAGKGKPGRAHGAPARLGAGSELYLTVSQGHTGTVQVTAGTRLGVSHRTRPVEILTMSPYTGQVRRRRQRPGMGCRASQGSSAGDTNRWSSRR